MWDRCERRPTGRKTPKEMTQMRAGELQKKRQRPAIQ